MFLTVCSDGQLWVHSSSSNFLLCMHLIRSTYGTPIYFLNRMKSNERKVKKKLLIILIKPWKEATFHTQPSWFQTFSEGLKAAAATCFSHRNNKWTYSACMGEWINQQRCCIVWNATINHRGLMSGREKGQRCMELWGEDAPFVVIYYSESIETGL